LAKDKTIEIKSDVRFSQIKPDQRNTNKHTDIGMRSLDSSLDQVGIVESITISNDNVIISGNARHEKIGQKYKKDPVIIETDGTTPIVIKRTDIESGTKEFHKASILSNSVAQKNQNLDIELVEVIADEFDFDVSDVFVEIEEEYDKDYSDKNKELSIDDFQNQKYYLKLEYTEDDYNFVKDKIQQLGQSPEKILYDALVSL
jgi:hypothetical protein